MKSDKIQDAIGLVNDEFIEDAHDASTYVKQKAESKKVVKGHRRWQQWGPVAACLCLVLVGALSFTKFHHTGNQEIAHNSTSPIVSENDNPYQGDSSVKQGVILSQPDFSLAKPKDGVAADMLAFFIYQGRCYMETKQVYNSAEALVGEKLGTATGLIDEWTPKDGYVELAGSVGGDFYTVNGYDPEFMLCMKRDDATVQIFVASGGMELHTGADLYKDKLHIESYTSVSYEDKDSWYTGAKNIKTLEDTYVIGKFINDIESAEFISAFIDGGPEGTKGEKTNPSMMISEMGKYRLTFEMPDGISIDMWILDDGYVFYDGIRKACVQISEAEYNNLINALK